MTGEFESTAETKLKRGLPACTGCRDALKQNTRCWKVKVKTQTKDKKKKKKNEENEKKNGRKEKDERNETIRVILIINQNRGISRNLIVSL